MLACSSKSARQLPFCWVLVLLSILALVSGHRQLAQLGGCKAQIPGCGSETCESAIVGSRSITVCPRCDGRWYKRSDDGTRCDCIPGAYANCSSSSSCECVRCPQGSWCSGGYNKADQAKAVPCGTGLTTRAVMAKFRSQCVLLPGWGWPSLQSPAPLLCPIGSYSYGGRASRTACTRCPSGLTTRNEGFTRQEDCLAGPGLYVDQGLVTPCPAGSYQPDYTMAGREACSPCATGVTTANAAAATAAECAVAQPGYGITACDATTGCQAELCSKGAYNTGGLGSSSCSVCPWGMTSLDVGSTDESLCRVPPGFGLVYPLPADTTVNAVVACTHGYNPGWNRQACTSCGQNIVSINNRTSAVDCYILKGQGVHVMAAADGSRVRTAVDCWPGSVGMAEDTPAASARPCDTCPRYTTTEQQLSSSKSDCKALPGYTPVVGVQPTMAAPCATGTYKSSLSNDMCTPCPGNTNTISTGATSADNCTVCVPGWGSWSAVGPLCSSQCAGSTYNDGSSTTCIPCPDGFEPTANFSSCQPSPDPAPPAVASPSPAPPAVASPSPAPPAVASPSPAPLPPTSVCQARPPASSFSAANIECPTGSWTPLAPGNSYDAPPACVPSNGGCKTAGGQFWDNVELVEVRLGSKTSMCYCKEAQKKGHVLRRVNAAGQPDPKGKFGCVPAAAFLPNDPTKPTGAGIWVLDTAATQTCHDSQTCWDMCFYCDGSARYMKDTSAALRKGKLTYRKIIDDKCNLISCALDKAEPNERTFYEACEDYAANASREKLGNLPLVGGVWWPFRPQPSRADLLLLAAPVNGVNGGVDQGQNVMQSWA